MSTKTSYSAEEKSKIIEECWSREERAIQSRRERAKFSRKKRAKHACF